MTETKTSDYTDFSLVSGGLIYSLTSVFRKNSSNQKALKRTAIGLIAITWIPLCILSLFEGTLHDTDLTISFFEDFSLHIRLLFVVPFLILIESFVDQAFIGYVKNTDKITPDLHQPKFNRLLKQLNKLSDSYIPEIFFLVIIYSLIYFNWDSLDIFSSGQNYLSHENTHQLNLAGWYYLFVCAPIFQLLIFRWLWRWIIWIYSVIRISRMELQVDPLHADNMAGLEYINIVPLAFSYILIAISAIFSAHIGNDIVYNGALLTQYTIPILAYIFILPVILYAPLLLFLPFLVKAKIYGIQNFGNLIRRHNKDYKNVWIEGNGKAGEQLLGTMDNSSLNDINGSYGFVKDMQFIPINTKMILLSFIMNIIPYLPLVFTYYTANELFNDFLKSIFAT